MSTVAENILNDSHRYIIRHKDIDVLSFRYDCRFSNCEILNKEHLPLYFINKYTLEQNLNEWLMTRCIPQNRKFYDRIIKAFDTADILMIPLETGAISLTDCYWIAKENDCRTWKEVNYFDNEFDSLLDHLYLSPQFGLRKRGDRIALTKILNPSQTLQGSLPKVWRIDSYNKRFMLKGCMKSSEVTNENLVTSMLNLSDKNKISNINEHMFVEYYEYYDDKENKLLTKCYNFMQNDEDFISADELLEYHKYNVKDAIEDSVEELIKLSENLGLVGLRNQIDFTRVLDFLICNEDRHWNNFGFIRNADTLELKCLAPIYDNGYSFFNDYDILDERIKYENFRDIESYLEPCTLRESLNKIKTDITGYLELNQVRGSDVYKNKFSIERQQAYNNYIDWAFSYLDKIGIKY